MNLLAAAATAETAVVDDGCNEDAEESDCDDGSPNVADGNPAVQPNLAVQTQSLHRRPNAVGQVIPEGGEPYHIDNVENRIGKGSRNPVEAGSRSECAFVAGQFGQHHIAPEVVEMDEDTADDDDAEGEHVLGSPVYGLLAGNGIAVFATSLPVLKRQHERIAEVDNYKDGQSGSAEEGIPVGAEKFTHLVVIMSVCRGSYHYVVDIDKVHQHMEGEEEHKAAAGYAHHNLTADGRGN